MNIYKYISYIIIYVYEYLYMFMYMFIYIYIFVTSLNSFFGNGTKKLGGTRGKTQPTSLLWLSPLRCVPQVGSHLNRSQMWINIQMRHYYSICDSAFIDFLFRSRNLILLTRNRIRTIFGKTQRIGRVPK